MKILWKLFVLVGEGWYCRGTYGLRCEAENAERALRQQGDTTMIRRVLM